MSNKTELYILRRSHYPLLVDTADSLDGSRVGGRPPQTLIEKPLVCPRCGGSVEYLLTISGEILGKEVASGQSVSLLYCRELKCRMESIPLTSPSSILLLTHPDSPRAPNPTDLDSPAEGRKLELGPLTPDPENLMLFDQSKLGGKPGYIQNWGYAEEEKAKNNGADFLLQWSENAYPAGMKTGPYPFLFGVVYIFCKFQTDTGLPELSNLRCFWQYT